ncbi:MAG TPA: type I phosphomannose isomerase catalytic subunit [Phycisphaerae bacterium]|nr:type I phosphomannose isomerase catalytic subunit [Phycisphaerae bacterium]
MQISPLIFEPIYRHKVWGGRNLERVLGKMLPPGEAIGESWECADVESAQSVVARGPAKGRSLRELVAEWGAGLTGRAELCEGRFPLLIKFLDATEALSIQVHPGDGADEASGRKKHEAWFVLDAAPGAVAYRGLASGVTLDHFREVCRREPQRVPELLNKIGVRAGDTFYVPGGTVHALGAGVVVAEVQTPSEVTYRLYDWGRTRAAEDGGLNVEKGLACVRADADWAACERRSHVTSFFTTVTRLVSCPRFVIERVRFSGEMEQEIPYAELVCWMVLEGRGEIAYGKGGVESFGRGEVVVLPAGLEKPKLRTKTDCVWLEVTVPVKSDLAGYEHPDAAALRAAEGGPGAPVQINISRLHRPTNR